MAILLRAAPQMPNRMVARDGGCYSVPRSV
jgi:hypothetical protein